MSDSPEATPQWNPEHLEIVRQGEEAIEAWRKSHPSERLNLAGADFRDANLSHANLEGVDLSDAHLARADLSYAHLERANLSFAHLEGANLEGAYLEQAKCEFAQFKGANLDGADLQDAEMMYVGLEGARLREAYLKGAILRLAYLESADLDHANLEDADLRNGHLKGASLSFARLERANLTEADLKEAWLIFAHLEGADLSLADLQGANLSCAHLERAILEATGLERTDLQGANLEEANLRNARLNHACLHEVQLTGAVLRGVGLDFPLWRRILLPWRYPFKLDFTRIRDTQFEPNVSDPWSILRRNYTGPQFALHLLFLLLFALPFFARSLYWRGVNEVQEIGYKAAVGQVRMAANHLRDSRDDGVRAWLQEADAFLQRADSEGRLAAYRELREVLESATKLESNANLLDPASLAKERLWASEAKTLLHLPLLRDEAHERPMWQLLVGLDKGLLYFLLVLLPVLLYNVLRAWLTYKVSLLRDAEERSGYSPRWSDYGWLYWLHQPARLLMIVALVAFCFNAWHWLTESVVVPY